MDLLGGRQRHRHIRRARRDVFIIFNRLHTRTEYPGNGIGLAICKKIIERHGGKIQAVPHEGGGTIFNFTLPAGKPVERQGRHDDNRG